MPAVFGMERPESTGGSEHVLKDDVDNLRDRHSRENFEGRAALSRAGPSRCIRRRRPSSGVLLPRGAHPRRRYSSVACVACAFRARRRFGRDYERFLAVRIASDPDTARAMRQRPPWARFG